MKKEIDAMISLPSLRFVVGIAHKDKFNDVFTIDGELTESGERVCKEIAKLKEDWVAEAPLSFNVPYKDGGFVTFNFHSLYKDEFENYFLNYTFDGTIS